MPKVTAATALVAALLTITLTGCAGAPDNTGDDRAEPAVSEPAAPASVEPTTPEEASSTDAEKYFLGSGFVPTIDLPDEEKISAGYFACERVAAGEYGVVAVQGVDAATNEEFVAAATTSLCPELADVYTEHRQF